MVVENRSWQVEPMPGHIGLARPGVRDKVFRVADERIANIPPAPHLSEANVVVSTPIEDYVAPGNRR